MQIKQLKKLLHEHREVQVSIISHASSHFYLIQIRWQDEVDLLTGWREQPKVYRSLDQASAELKLLGIKQAHLVHSVPQDEIIGRPAHYSTATHCMPVSL